MRSDLVRRQLPYLQGASPGSGQPPHPDPSPRGPAAAGARELRRGRGAAIDARARAEQEAHDREVAAAARGVAQVDRAVRRYRRGAKPVHVTPAIAEELGWTLCACGGGGIRPGATVTYLGREWHVLCALEVVAQLDQAAA